MGGAVADDEALQGRWEEERARLIEEHQTLIFPVGSLRVGLQRHRAFLFKAVADFLEIPSQILRGKFYCGDEDCVMIIVMCGGAKRALNLMEYPGQMQTPYMSDLDAPSPIPDSVYTPSESGRDSPDGPIGTPSDSFDQRKSEQFGVLSPSSPNTPDGQQQPLATQLVAREPPALPHAHRRQRLRHHRDRRPQLQRRRERRRPVAAARRSGDGLHDLRLAAPGGDPRADAAHGRLL